MLEKLRTLLGIVENDKDDILQFTIDNVTDMVLNYCNIDELPIGLVNTVLAICVDKYRVEGYGQEIVQGPIKSISEGDVSVSFGSAYTFTESSTMNFLKNYKEQLDRYRKIGRW